VGAGVGVSFLFSKKDYHHTKKHLFFLTSKNIFQTFSKHFPTPLETPMSNMRRITPTYAAEAYANPLFHSDLPLVAPTLVRTDTIHDGGLSRQNTMVIEPPTEDSDTELEPDTMGDVAPYTTGYMITVGENGYYRPSLDRIDTSDDEDGLVPVKRPVRRPATPKKSVKRKARFHADELTDDDDDDTTTVVRTAPTPVGRGQGNKSSRWCFTYNNPPLDGDEFVSLLESKGDIKMAVFQKETGEEGTEHFQGYMETNKRMYTTGVHSMLAPHKLALLHAKGTKIQNHKYCTKEETRTDGPYYVKSEAGDYGRKNGNQGKRTDLDEFAALVIEEGGITERVIAEQPGHVMAYSKHANNLIGYIAYNKAKADDMAFWKEQYRKHAAGEESLGQQQRKLILRFGPTAVGKTTEVKREIKGGLGKEVYEKMATNKWWDNYKQEEHVLVDEFVGNQSIDEFKAMSNCGVVQMESKGTMGLFSATHIYYTTNRHPSQWWKRNNDEYHNWNSPDFKAVARRFAEVHWWNDAGTKVILTNPGKEQNTPEWRSAVVQWNKFWKWEKENPHDGERYFTL